MSVPTTPATVRTAEVDLDLQTPGVTAALDSLNAAAKNDVVNTFSFGDEGFAFPFKIDGKSVEGEIIDLDVDVDGDGDNTTRLYIRVAGELHGSVKVVNHDVTGGLLETDATDLTVEVLDAAFEEFASKTSGGNSGGTTSC